MLQGEVGRVCTMQTSYTPGVSTNTNLVHPGASECLLRMAVTFTTDSQVIIVQKFVQLSFFLFRQLSWSSMRGRVGVPLWVNLLYQRIWGQ